MVRTWSTIMITGATPGMTKLVTTTSSTTTTGTGTGTALTTGTGTVAGLVGS